jgi:hypothetical protein
VVVGGGGGELAILAVCATLTTILTWASFMSCSLASCSFALDASTVSVHTGHEGWAREGSKAATMIATKIATKIAILGSYQDSYHMWSML